MGFSREKMRQIALLMLLAAALALAVIYSSQLAAAAGALVSILSPFIAGCAIAFVLNLPLRFLERRVFARWNGKAKRAVCILLSLVFVLLLVTFVVVMVVPQLVAAGQRLAQQVPLAIEKLAAWLYDMSVKYPALNNEAAFLSELESNWQSILENILSFAKSGLGSVLSSTINFASSAVSGVVNGFIALIFSFYVLAQKETLTSQCRRVITAYLPQKAAALTLEICGRLYKNFSSFITGQCIEAVILGSMFVIAMTVLRMPYAVMIGVLIAFTALIPIVGAFIGCVVGAFMILIENPLQALAFVVMFLILQQLENNLIYPHVVGSSVGLPSMWVLAAVTVGGSLFGVGGMLVFIPLVSTLYSLLRDSVNARNAAKAAAGELPPDDSAHGAQKAELPPAAEKKE